MHHSFFIHSSFDRHLSCFHVFAIVHCAAVNTELQVTFSYRYIPRSGTAGSLLVWFAQAHKMEKYRYVTLTVVNFGGKPDNKKQKLLNAAIKSRNRGMVFTQELSHYLEYTHPILEYLSSSTSSTPNASSLWMGTLGGSRRWFKWLSPSTRAEQPDWVPDPWLLPDPAAACTAAWARA